MWDVMNRLGYSFSDLLQDFLPTLFRPCLPLRSALTIFDSFMIEGRKILTRVSIGLLKEAKNDLLLAKTPAEFKATVLSRLSEASSLPKLRQLLDTSSKVFVPSSKKEAEASKTKKRCSAIDKLIRSMNSWFCGRKESKQWSHFLKRIPHQ